MSEIDEIKSRLNILDIVSGYVKLEKSGNQYKSKCPFHNERTPSFYVSPSRGTFHCFGCGVSGDMFSFLEKIEHIEFKDALKILADRAGVSLNKNNNKQYNNLFTILDLAKNFYIQNLKDNFEAIEYLHKRGLNDDSIKFFELGFALNNWRDLYNFLKNKNFSDNEIVDSGLVIKTDENKYYDRFRGRIMFPIYNSSGVVVGFTGRILPKYDDGKVGKYVNTPETKLYHKSNILYNFNNAKKFIAENKEIILVEGQMDVILSYQVGVKNVVAVSGTAFTQEQVKIINRLADKVVLAFDNDAAGHKASERAGIMCTYGGMEVYIVNLLGKDVADMVFEDKNSWIEILKQKILLIDYYIQNAIKLDFKSRVSYIRNYIIPLLKGVRSPLERDMFILKVSNDLALDVNSLKSEIDNYISEYKEEEIVNNNLQTEINFDLELASLEKFLFNKVDDKFPEEIIESKIIDLERKDALNEKYYQDLLNIKNKKDKENKIKLLKQKIQNGENVEENLKILQELISN